MFALEDLWRLINYLKEKEAWAQDHPDDPEIPTSELTPDSLRIDSVTRTIADNEKDTTDAYFANIIDQPSFASADYNRTREFFVDWYASLKTLVTTQKNIADLFQMPTDHLDELFKSFGYELSLSSMDSESKVYFFRDLVNFYKSKGTIETLANVLEYYGFIDSDIVEYWLQYDEAGRLVFAPDRTRAASTGSSSSLLLNFDVPYEDMIRDDPHWFYTEEQIRRFTRPDTLVPPETPSYEQMINLPSKSPYFSLASAYSVVYLNIIMGILQRVIQDQYVYYMSTPINGALTDSDIIISPAIGDAYLIFGVGENDWVGHDNEIATWNGVAWDYTQPESVIGAKIPATTVELEKTYKYNGVDWTLFMSGSIPQNISINKIGITLSLFELYLSIIVLFRERFGDWAVTTDANHVCYNQLNDAALPVNIQLCKTYIKEMTDLLTAPIDSRDDRDTLLDDISEDWTRDMDTNFFRSKTAAYDTLNQINPQLVDFWQIYINDGQMDFLILNLFTSLNSWIRTNIAFDAPNLIITTLGFTFTADIKEIINFFKPYRARLKYSEGAFVFNDTVGDRIIFDEYNHLTIEQTIIDDDTDRTGDGIIEFPKVEDELGNITIIMDPFAEDHLSCMPADPVLGYENKDWRQFDGNEDTGAGSFCFDNLYATDDMIVTMAVSFFDMVAGNNQSTIVHDGVTFPLQQDGSGRGYIEDSMDEVGIIHQAPDDAVVTTDGPVQQEITQSIFSILTSRPINQQENEGFIDENGNQVYNVAGGWSHYDEDYGWLHDEPNSHGSDICQITVVVTP